MKMIQFQIFNDFMFGELSVLGFMNWNHLGVSKNRGETPKMDGL